MEFLASLEATELSQWIRFSFWGAYILLSFHAIGMALVVGLVLMMDIRMLGYAKGITPEAFSRMLPVAWAGFAVNFLSGLLLFVSNGTKLILNWSFQLKMSLIAAGGLSLWLLWRSVRSEIEIAGDFAATTNKQRVLAVASIIFWIGALTAGRLIAYTLTPF